ncbi:MAG: ATP-binding protein, partial [Candidatus Korarchaeota archaeon]
IIEDGARRIVGIVKDITVTAHDSTAIIMYAIQNKVIPTIPEPHLTGELQLVGVIGEQGLRRVSNPPLPFSPVYIPHDDEFVPSGKEYVKIGTFRGTNAPFKIDLEVALTKSIGIFGAQGAGKSFTALRVIEALASLKSTPNVLIFDHVGEYSRSDIVEIFSNVKVLDGRDFPPVFVSGGDILDTLYLNTLPTQAQNACAVASEMFITKFMKGEVSLDSTEFFALVDEFMKQFYQKGGSVESWSKVIRERVRAFGAGLFNGAHVNEYDKLWNYCKGKIVILDVSSEPLDLKQVKLGYIASQILYKRLPIHLIIDEAKNYIPETTGGMGVTAPGKFSLSAPKLIALLEEGRKFGSSLTIINQRPSRISKSIIAGLQTLFVGRLQYETDIKIINEVSDADISKLLPQLNPGEFIITGVGSPFPEPVVVSIEKPLSKLWGSESKFFALHSLYSKEVVTSGA